MLCHITSAFLDFNVTLVLFTKKNMDDIACLVGFNEAYNFNLYLENILRKVQIGEGDGRLLFLNGKGYDFGHLRQVSAEDT